MLKKISVDNKNFLKLIFLMVIYFFFYAKNTQNTEFIN